VGPTVPFPVEVAASVELAVRDADIVVTATTASSPVIRSSWLKAGSHVNAVGTGWELDVAVLAAAELFTDRRESIEAEARDFRAAAQEGLIGAAPVELGEVITGRAPARSGPAAITVFRSLGLACEDLYAAQRAAVRARAIGLGTDVPM